MKLKKENPQIERIKKEDREMRLGIENPNLFFNIRKRDYSVTIERDLKCATGALCEVIKCL